MVQRQCGTHPRAEQEGDIGAASVVRASVLMGNTRPVFPHPLQKTFGASHALRASVLIDLGLVSEAPWSTLGGGANKKFWFFGSEFYFFSSPGLVRI
jgi:hypothetical protein